MKKPFYQILYVQVLIAIAIGVAVGAMFPSDGVAMKPFGDGFIKLIKMIIAPVIFCTVVSGIAGMENMKKLGRVGGKALLYFEVVSTIALAIGLLVAHLLRPGDGFIPPPAAKSAATAATLASVPAPATANATAASASATSFASAASSPATASSSSPASSGSGKQPAAADAEASTKASSAHAASVPAALVGVDTSSVAEYTKAKPVTAIEFLMNIIPTTVVDAFAKGEILQVLLFSILFGLALSHLGPKGKPTVALIDDISKAVFGVVNIIMKAAPIGAFGAMAFTIGKYGFHALIPLAKLMGAFYLTSAIFVLVVLGLIAKFVGFSIIRYLVYIKEELLIVLGTSSSESALPSIMTKLEKLGCAKPVVGLVVPTGYSFNLDGTNIYMTLAALFIAQATDTDLTLMQELSILAVAMATSKGASGVTGAGFITLAATLAVVPSIPVAGMALILGIDRFMSECRALTNFIGNGVAAIVVSAWENELDYEQMKAELHGVEKQIPLV